MRGDSEKCLEYKGLVGREAKAKFRAKWAATKLEAAEKRALKEEKHSLSEETDGVYLPFKVLWDREGGDAAAFKALGTIPYPTLTLTIVLYVYVK